MRRGKNNALTLREMTNMNKAVGTNNHLYPSDGIERREAISGIVETICGDVSEIRQRVDLRDTETVRGVTKDYVTSCIAASVLPSKAGLSRALGYSRKGVYLFVRDHPEEPSAMFLEIVFDAFSEAIDTAASGGAVHPIYAIFTQKAQFEMRDNLPLPPVHDEDPLGPCESLEILKQKYEMYCEEG